MKKGNSAKCGGTFVVIILHQHGSEMGTTTGKITVSDFDDTAVACVQSWFDRKRAEHRCADYGDNCYIDVRTPNTSLKTMGIDIGAEEIALTTPA